VLYVIRKSGLLGVFALGLALLGSGKAFAATASVSVDLDKPGHAVSPQLYGIFFEEINRAGDGGLYAEMLQNRSFEDDGNEPVAWVIAGAVTATLDKTKPLSAKNPRALFLKFKKDSGTISNSGFSRAKAKEKPAYEGGLVFRQGEALHFAIYQRGQAALEVRLEGHDGKVLAQSDLPAPQSDWKRVELTLTPATTDLKGHLVLAGKSTGALWIDELSLMPVDTWKGHGLRKDLAAMVADMKPGFVRFPGGCFVEGYNQENSTRWKDTVGDSAQRRGVQNLWGYHTTSGFGVYEFFQWCEDLGAEPLYVINCGMNHAGSVPLNEMNEWVQDAVDLVEYARGPADSKWGALRATAGHPAPFKLNYMEIGNENGGPQYAQRYALIYDALKANYPDIHLIANDWNGVPENRPVEYRDEHFYTDPATMEANASRYDSYDRKGSKVYVGEYAVTQGSGDGNLVAAVAEAACMTGLETNSDIVQMSSYAPLFVHPAWKAWTPNAIVFDESRLYGTPSYHVQAMFAGNRSDLILPISLEQPKMDYIPPKGVFGLGTWGTQAEYKDFKFTARDGKVIFTSDFSKGMDGWKALHGSWEAKDGVLSQTGGEDHAVAIVTGSHWGDGTLSVKARKKGGREGFMVLFQADDEEQHRWWNLGGWGNTVHALEQVLDTPKIPGSIETGRWYNIRIELAGAWVRCYLDGKLVQEARRVTPKALYATAGKTRDGEELIMKLVNVGTLPMVTSFHLRGAESMGRQGRAIVLTSKDASDENSFADPKRVAPVESKVKGMGKAFTRTLPPLSVTILRVSLKTNSKGSGL
jgi:alpha-L-arabinofuranosidase